MNRSEHLLSCLAEECCEVGQRVSKALRFGLGEVQSGQRLNNAERISEELRDLIAVVKIMEREGILIKSLPHADQIGAKQKKIELYMELAINTGALQGR